MEYSVEIDEESTKSLLECFHMGPIVDDSGMRLLLEEEVDRFGGLKIDVFSKEHPPPHFRVLYQGDSETFTIEDCRPLQKNGGLKPFHRNIKAWWKKNKRTLIKTWDRKRPTDCPVGAFKD